MSQHPAATNIPERAEFADVRRAIDRFRRGDPVLIEAGGARALGYAAETLDEAGLATALAVTQNLRLATTGFRASALGLDAAPREPTVIGLPAAATLSQVRAVTDPATVVRQSTPIGTVREVPAAARPLVAAAVALAKLAGLMPAALIGDVAAAAACADVPVVSGGHALRFLEYSARWLTRVAEARVPLADAETARIVAFRPYDGGAEALAIVIGEPDVAAPVLTRIHSACFTGDLLGSLRCDCGDQLRGAIRAIAAEGSGVIVYLPQEGRGIGLVNKLRAYALQDSGLDTFDANLRLGFAPDERSYAAAGEILRQLGIRRIRLLTNNPGKIDALAELGCEVIERVPHAFAANPHNVDYLRAKAIRGGHNF